MVGILPTWMLDWMNLPSNPVRRNLHLSWTHTDVSLLPLLPKPYSATVVTQCSGSIGDVSNPEVS